MFIKKINSAIEDTKNRVLVFIYVTTPKIKVFVK